MLGDQNSGPTDDLQWLWPYVYICSGIAGLVVIVITVTLFIIRCQGEWFGSLNKTLLFNTTTRYSYNKILLLFLVFLDDPVGTKSTRKDMTVKNQVSFILILLSETIYCIC